MATLKIYINDNKDYPAGPAADHDFMKKLNSVLFVDCKNLTVYSNPVAISIERDPQVWASDSFYEWVCFTKVVVSQVFPNSACQQR